MGIKIFDIIHIAVGIILDKEQNILVAKRRSHVDHGGLWEFPGGKVEAGESVYEALCRELKEEIDIEVQDSTPLIKIPYDYGKYSVLLDTWRINRFEGEAYGAEGQIVRWMNLAAIKNLNMPAANHKIIHKLISCLS